jgi:phosphohistidine phosphatase
VKTLILFRHGKSDWNTDYGADHDRPLAKRGRNAAATMGTMLARTEQIPDRVLTSSAVRARDTVELAAEAGGWKCPVEIVPEFYGSSPATVVARVREESDAASSLLLAGHEPTWSTLAAELTGGGFLRFPTAAMVRIDLDLDSWSRLEVDKGMLVWFLIPRLVKAMGLPADP